MVDGANVESAFAGGAFLYVPALLLIAAEAGLSPIARALGALAALPFGAHAVAYYLGADVYPLLLVGGFPTSTDPSAMSSWSPLTIVAAMLGLLSISLYAGWAIWTARRLSRPV